MRGFILEKLPGYTHGYPGKFMDLKPNIQNSAGLKLCTSSYVTVLLYFKVFIIYFPLYPGRGGLTLIGNLFKVLIKCLGSGASNFDTSASSTGISIDLQCKWSP